jgi:hypothetical protein
MKETDFRVMSDAELRVLGRSAPALREAIVTELKRRESLKLAAIASRLS